MSFICFRLRNFYVYYENICIYCEKVNIEFWLPMNNFIISPERSRRTSQRGKK